MKNPTTYFLGVLGVVLLPSCGDVTPDDEYGSSEDLRSALESEGFECNEARAQEVFDGYGDELWCHQGYALRVWDQDLPDSMDDPGTSGALGGTLHLRGENWDIAHGEEEFLERVQQSLGGDVTIRGLAGITDIGIEAPN